MVQIPGLANATANQKLADPHLTFTHLLLDARMTRRSFEYGFFFLFFVFIGFFGLWVCGGDHVSFRCTESDLYLYAYLNRANHGNMVLMEELLEMENLFGNRLRVASSSKGFNF